MRKFLLGSMYLWGLDDENRSPKRRVHPSPSKWPSLEKYLTHLRILHNEKLLSMGQKFIRENTTILFPTFNGFE
jgi:hypothetical protein